MGSVLHIFDTTENSVFLLIFGICLCSFPDSLFRCQLSVVSRFVEVLLSRVVGSADLITNMFV